MKNITKGLILSLITAVSLVTAAPVFASTPFLSASYQGSNNIQITVNSGNPNSQIDLYFQSQGSMLWNNVINIGRTDFNGYFTQSISLGSSAYNISQVYVIVGGVQSQPVTVFSGSCTYNCGSPYGLSLSQNNLTLSSGQSSTVTIYNNGSFSNSFYISSNANSNIASASISGNSLNVYANQTGSTTITVCQNGSSACVSLFITVNGGNGCSFNCGGLTVSQTNVNVNIGQSAYVSLSYSGNNFNNFYISGNSNSSVASASVSGNQLLIQGINTGSSTINVCASNNSSACASVFVTVGGCSFGNCSGTLALSQTSLSLNSGQSAFVNASNFTGLLYVSSNSSPNVASVSISGSSVSISAIANGSTTISICANSGSQCGNIFVTVNGGFNNSLVWFSQNSVSLTNGQNTLINIYSNNYTGSYYLSVNSNPSAVTANVSGNTLSVMPQGIGSSTLTICQSTGSGCGTVFVTSNGNSCGYYGCGTNTNITLSQTSLSLSQGQSAAINIYGSGNYYISSNSNSSAASASINGSVLNVYGANSGSSTISICQNSGSGCASLYVTVGGYYGGGVLGANTYQNGQLVSEYGTVFIVYKNTKTGFVSASVFQGLGFSFGNVLNVGNSGLTNSGYTVQTAQASHPWGSWVKNGGTVYFVHELGLIPIPDWNTFLNNGGQANLIVNANSYDFRLSMLSPMVTNDSRLR